MSASNLSSWTSDYKKHSGRKYPSLNNQTSFSSKELPVTSPAFEQPWLSVMTEPSTRRPKVIRHRRPSSCTINSDILSLPFDSPKNSQLNLVCNPTSHNVETTVKTERYSKKSLKHPVFNNYTLKCPEEYHGLKFPPERLYMPSVIKKTRKRPEESYGLRHSPERLFMPSVTKETQKQVSKKSQDSPKRTKSPRKLNEFGKRSGEPWVSNVCEVTRMSNDSQKLPEHHRSSKVRPDISRSPPVTRDSPKRPESPRKDNARSIAVKVTRELKIAEKKSNATTKTKVSPKPSKATGKSKVTLKASQASGKTIVPSKPPQATGKTIVPPKQSKAPGRTIALPKPSKETRKIQVVEKQAIVTRKIKVVSKTSRALRNVSKVSRRLTFTVLPHVAKVEVPKRHFLRFQFPRDVGYLEVPSKGKGQAVMEFLPQVIQNRKSKSPDQGDKLDQLLKIKMSLRDMWTISSETIAEVELAETSLDASSLIDGRSSR